VEELSAEELAVRAATTPAEERPGISFRTIGPVELKGVTHPVLVHEAIALR
jgi:hypothetical protein